MTGDATIDYEALQQDALRGLVRSILVRVSKTGLPGDHHLYISFDVRASGVILSKRLREKYPSEMTIVLQHRFKDLIVGDERFEVKLSFDGIPERLVVPFAAIKVFLDPSVRYVLHFEEPASAHEGNSTGLETVGDSAGRPAGPKSIVPKKPRGSKVKSRSELDKMTISSDQKSLQIQTRPNTPVGLPAPKPKPSDAAVLETETTTAGEAKQRPQPSDRPAAGSSAQVVSLDAFRKK